MFKNFKWLVICSVLVVVYLILSVVIFTHSAFQHELLLFLAKSENNIFLISLVLIVLGSIGLPRQVIAVTCGYLLDILTATFLATIITTSALLITYSVSSTLQKNPFILKYEIKFKKISLFLSEHTFHKSIIIRLLPVGSNFLTNVFAGITKVPLIPFILGSTIGFIPQLFIFSLIGAGIKLDTTQHLLISLTLFFIALLIGWHLYRKTPLYTQ